MAYEEALKSVSKPAAADLSAKQYFAVELNSSGQAALAGNGERIFGVLQNKPNAAGEVATVGVSGITKASAGGIIAPGGDVGVDANGEFVPAATGDVIVGVNASDYITADGDIFSLFLQPRGAAKA